MQQLDVVGITYMCAKTDAFCANQTVGTGHRIYSNRLRAIPHCLRLLWEPAC